MVYMVVISLMRGWVIQELTSLPTSHLMVKSKNIYYFFFDKSRFPSKKVGMV
jgi:hypothetical protein